MTADATSDVVVVGGGPVGLMLAAELRLGGVGVLVLERRTEIDPTFKAFGLHLPTVEALDRRGLLPAVQVVHRRNLRRLVTYLTANQEALAAFADSAATAGHFAGVVVRRTAENRIGLDGRDANGLLPVGQQDLEAIIEGRARELGAGLRRGAEVVGFDEDGAGVTVHLDDGTTIRTRWLVGADGGRSTVRKTAGFAFPGTDPEIVGWQAVVELVDARLLRPGWNRTRRGVYVYTPAVGRILLIEPGTPPPDRRAPVTREEFEAALRRVSGSSAAVASMASATRFTDHARQATTYRRGRILLAGDAAHVHSPLSGQGLNLGIGDAVNLGWKLAATVGGWAPDGLLDTYTEERHQVGACVLDWTRAQSALLRTDELTDALRRVVGDLVNTADGARYVVRMQAGRLRDYGRAEGEHALVGRGAPDVVTRDGRRLADLLHRARPLLVGPPADADIARGWTRRLDVVDGPGPRLLIRPDGYVAWASDDPDDLAGLDAALRRWLGSPASGR